jgi:predicted DCC family thiol-disulfide oxidoreductase YuxK
VIKRAVRYPLTVYYDASCPMCASEMHVLRDRDRDGRLQLVDCSAADFDDTALLASGVDREKLMTLIHGRDAYGRWLVGPDCFQAAYGAVGLKLAARVWGSHRLRPIWRRVYPWIARNRQLLSRIGAHRLIRLLNSVLTRRY